MAAAPAEELVKEGIPAPVNEDIMEPVMTEPVEKEEEMAVVLAEEEIVVVQEEELEIEEEVVAVQEEELVIEEEIVVEEEMIEEAEPGIVAGEEIKPEPEPVEKFVAEEEIEIADEREAEAGPQHPAFAAGREQSQLRPMPVPQPSQKPAARKFDLREILHRQRQTRLGQHRGVAPSEPAAARPAPPQPRPAAPVRPAIERTPNPERVSPIRPIAATRGTSPFIPTKAGNVPAVTARIPGQQQATFDEHLVPVVRSGRFEKTVPTVEEGEDLDVPTFLRKNR